MATVMLRNHGISIDAESVGDLDTKQALEFAGDLHDNGVTFDKAYVDRFDGLVLEGPRGTYHFSTPLCGYGGTGPTTTVVILELFEFGKRDEIMPQIDHGDNTAKAVFYR